MAEFHFVYETFNNFHIHWLKTSLASIFEAKNSEQSIAWTNIEISRSDNSVFRNITTSTIPFSWSRKMDAPRRTIIVETLIDEYSR